MRTRTLSNLVLLAAIAAPPLSSAAHAWVGEIVGQCETTDSADQTLVKSIAVVPGSVAGAGDVVAVGEERKENGLPYFTVARWSAEFGTELWRHAEVGQGSAAAVDSLGDVLAVGNLPDDFGIVKLDGASGGDLWRSVGIKGFLGAETLAIDGADDVLVGGSLHAAGSSARKFGVRKLRGTDGATVWNYAPDAFGGDGEALAVRIAGDGNVLAAGKRIVGCPPSCSSDGPGRFAVVKLDAASGAQIWATSIGAPGNNTFSRAYSLAEDENGDVFAAGSLGNGSLIVKLSGSTGAELWRAEFGGELRFVRALPGGDVVSGGNTLGTSGLRRFDGATGSEVWLNDGLGILSSATVEGSGDIAVGRENGVAVVSAATGATLWQDPAGGNRVFSVAPAGGDAIALGGWGRGGTLSKLCTFRVEKRDAADGADYAGTPTCGNALVEGPEVCDDGDAAAGDGCDASCQTEAGWFCPAGPFGGECTAVCGDESTVGDETCDNGATNGAPSDPCDAQCRLRREAGGTVPESGGCVATALDTTSCVPDGATPALPVALAVQVPPLGQAEAVQITVESATLPMQTGFTLVGKQVVITAPEATAESPLVFTFLVDESAAPAVGEEGQIVVYRNGSPAGECPGSTQAVPDPCVTSRARVVGGPNDGDVLVTALSSRASAWAMAVRRSFSEAETACRKEIRKQVLAHASGRLRALQRCIDQRNAGKLATSCPDLKTEEKLAKVEKKVDVKRLSRACPPSALADVGVAGSCGQAGSVVGFGVCLRARSTAVTARFLDVEYARPSDVLASIADQKCQAAIAKEAGAKYAVSRLKTFSSCADKVESGKLLACLDVKSATKVAKAAAKVPVGVARRCSDPIPAILAGQFGAPCDTSASVDDLASCELAVHDLGTDELLGILP